MSSAKVDYRLTALDGFACLGGDCPATCCSVGWDIEVDQEVIARWTRFPENNERSRLLASMREVQRGGQPMNLLRYRQNNSCMLLETNGLCSAQARHGEEYIPIACRLHPRMKEESARYRVSSASLSCPEIARRVIFPGELAPVIVKTTADIPTLGTPNADVASYLLSELVDTVISAPSYPISVRLYFLAETVAHIGNPSNVSHADIETLASLHQNCHEELKKVHARIQERRIAPDPAISGSLWNTLFQLGRARGLLPDPPAHESALLAGLASLPTDRRRYYRDVYAEIEGYRLAALPWIEQSNPGLMRYLQAQMLNSGFPWQPSRDSYIATYLNAILPFAITMLRLWLMVASGNIRDNLLVECVYGTGRAFSHNTLIYGHLRDNPALLEIGRYHASFVDL